MQLENPYYSLDSKVYFTILQNQTHPQIFHQYGCLNNVKYACCLQGRYLQCQQLLWNKIGAFCGNYFMGRDIFGYYTKKMATFFTVKFCTKNTLIYFQKCLKNLTKLQVSKYKHWTWNKPMQISRHVISQLAVKIGCISI